MKTLTLLALALTLTGCAALGTRQYGACVTPDLGDFAPGPAAFFYPARVVLCTVGAVVVATKPGPTYAPPPADPAPPLPAPLAEHPPVTPTRPALHD